MGCKGPVTFQNCPNVRWNEGTNWPIGCGHPCIGCAEPDFWDKMTPFYRHLPASPASASRSSIDTRRRCWATVGVGAAFAGHGLISARETVAAHEPPRNAARAARAEPTKGGRP